VTLLPRANTSFHRCQSLAIAPTRIRWNSTHMDRDISPPSAKRRRTGTQTAIPVQTSSSSASAVLPALEANILRIFSWKVNGVAPFLQKSITSFFLSPKAKTGECQGGKDAIPHASLRGFLHRHNWPAMLLLQEVKIASKDTKAQNEVKAAVNSQSPSELGPDTRIPLYEVH
jgi:hypothetical protein